MDASQLVRTRLAVQRLAVSGPGVEPAEVVRGLLAVQSQDFEPACWSVAMRTGSAISFQDVVDAFDRGLILRTHVLRPTWHFVHRDDLAWLLTVTAPRVQVINGSLYRSLDLGPATLQRGLDAIVGALDGTAMTRRELADVLAGHGIEATGPRLAYIMMNAELEQAVCSGPLHGKQHTYAVFDQRIQTTGAASDPDEALPRLAHRFFAGHGPGTAEDLRRWASLTVTQTRAAIDGAADGLETAEVEGRIYHWTAASEPTTGPRVHLLQMYDEFISGFPDSRGLIDDTGQASGDERDLARALTADLLVDGHLAGTWRRTLSGKQVTIEVAPARPVDGDLRDAIRAAADRYAAYQGRALAPVSVAVAASGAEAQLLER